jgi:hypothetical protein
MIYIIRPAAFLFRCFSEFRKKVHRPRKYLKNSYHFRPLVRGSPEAQQPQSERLVFRKSQYTSMCTYVGRRCGSRNDGHTKCATTTDARNSIQFNTLLTEIRLPANSSTPQNRHHCIAAFQHIAAILAFTDHGRCFPRSQADQRRYGKSGSFVHCVVASLPLTAARSFHQLVKIALRDPPWTLYVQNPPRSVTT